MPDGVGKAESKRGFEDRKNENGLRIIFLSAAGFGNSPGQKLRLFATVLGFIALMTLLFTTFIHMGLTKGKHGFKRWQAFTFVAVLLIYVGVIVFGVL